MRQCGGCTLCCKLIPVEELGKKAGERCRHQRSGKGCAIYERRPMSCREWSCLWLKGTEDGGPLQLGRPDRTHYVIDETPDMVRVRDDDTGEIVEEILCLQVWCDPLFPDAWQDPALLDMLERGSIVALVRYSSRDAFTVFPPGRTSTGKWARSARQECSGARDLEEARLQARLEFWAKNQTETSDDGECEKIEAG